MVAYSSVHGWIWPNFDLIISLCEFFYTLRAANSKVCGQIGPKFELVRDFIIVLLICKNEEDPIKNEGARVLTRLYVVFSDARGPNLKIRGGILTKFELIQAFTVVLINYLQE